MSEISNHAYLHKRKFMNNTDNIDQICEAIIHNLNAINVILKTDAETNTKVYDKSVKLMLKDVHLSIMRHYYRQDMDNANYQNNIEND